MSRFLEGRLHVYSASNGSLTIFESGDCSSSSTLLFIGGLTEVFSFSILTNAQGFMATPYVTRLSSELNHINWSLCQLHMRSSYMGYGMGSLNRDFEDICAAVTYLNALGKRQVVLMGHSTGSQNSVHYLLKRTKTESAPTIQGVIVPTSRSPFPDWHSFRHLSATGNSYASNLGIPYGTNKSVLL